MTVFVLDKRKKPLMPCTNRRARVLLRKGRARVHKLHPFTIRLVDRYVEDSVLQDLTVKIDPGSKGTGIALVREVDIVDPLGEIHRDIHVISLFELWHRGLQIHLAMKARTGHRRFRRSKLRYRPCRFNNRTRLPDWLPPSLMHRVESTITQVKRLMSLCPITKGVMELVSFDTRKLKDPNIKGSQYQLGPLHAKSLREYLFQKHQGKCFYCGNKSTHMELEHIVPRAKGGVSSVNNYVLACKECNIAKGTKSITEMLWDKPDILATLKEHYKTTYRDAAAVNSTKNLLLKKLRGLLLDVETSIGAITMENRIRLGLPKHHCIDAACAGFVSIVHLPKGLFKTDIFAMGRGQYQRTLLTEDGFPRAYSTRIKRHYGFQTGDICQAIVTKGKKIGTYVGRVAVRATGYFNIRTKESTIQGIHHHYCKLLQRSDGYQYISTLIA